MCGIFGYLSQNRHDLSSTQSVLKAMGEAIYHRGPDDEGYYLNGPIALGMRRLAIIDLSTGQQPITNEDKTLWIVFNGEIYNYRDLYEKLIKLGHTFTSKSDTECIIHLYEEYQEKCLDYLEGMFTFAIWNSQKQELFIARDRLGEKPLHYGIFGDTFIFGSEIKSLLKHPAITLNPNQSAISQYLSLEYVPSPDSLFAGIQKLLPGHYLTLKLGNSITIKPYWHPKTQINHNITKNEASSIFRNLLQESIEKCLISEVPLGVFLSGGLDSSAIALFASQLINQKPLNSFSIGFEDKSFDESIHAKAMADKLGLNHHNYIFKANIARDCFNDLWKVLDEPIGDASIIPSFFLAKMARQSVTVALAGEGGDELFGGYPTYMAHNYAKSLSRIPKFIRHNFLEKFVSALPVSHKNLSLDYKAKRFFKHLDAPYLTRHLRWMGSFNLSEQNQLLKTANLSELTNELELLNSGTLPKTLFPTLNGLDLELDKVMLLDLSSYLPDDLLVKSDRASMANSLELRLPFLNHKIVEFALSLPTHLKIHQQTTKYLFREAFKDLLPQEILNRPKKGFGIPVAKWINEDLKDLTIRFFDPKFIAQQEIFNNEYIANMLYLHQEHKVDLRKELWTLLMFQTWYDKFFN